MGIVIPRKWQVQQFSWNKGLITYHESAPNLSYLLQFYSVEWLRENPASESEWDSGYDSDKSPTFEDLARSDPSRCLEALAA
jgi:hypothetical protein